MLMVGTYAGVAYAGIMELQRETERLVEEIYARGGFESRQDVLAQAVRLLDAEAQSEQIARGAVDTGRRRRKWTIVALLVQLAVTIFAVAACAVDIETILYSGPALALSGMATVALGRPLCSRPVVAYGLSAPLVCAVGAALIVAFKWGPGEAEEPILVLLAVYTALIAIPAAVIALPVVFQWQPMRVDRKPFNWQFSLRSLLLVTTAACILVPIVKFAFTERSPNDLWIFGIFIVLSIGLVGLSIFLFVHDLSRRAESRACARPLESAAAVSLEPVATTQQPAGQPQTPPADPHRLDRYG
jgi:hypothetical protein